MSRRIAGLHSQVFALTCAVLLVAYPVAPRAADYALMVPGAAHSLLLDIGKAGERLVEVGERGHILYSDDEGTNWTQARVPTSEMLTRVFFIDTAHGWAVGHGGNILVSDDGGMHWELQREGMSAQAKINEERLARARAELEALRSQRRAESDDTVQWGARMEDAEHVLDLARQAVADPVFPPPLMSVWFSSEAQGWAAGAFGTLLQTTDGGRHWEDQARRVDNPDELHFNAVAGDAGGNLYLASEWGTVFRSRDGGESWEARETGYDGSFFGLLVNPVTQSIFAYGIQGTIYRSRDSGESWEALDAPGRDSLFGAAFSDDGTLLFVGDNGSALTSSDDGGGFALLSTPDRRKLSGVVALGGGRFAATGEGGSVVLSTAARVGR